MLLNVRSADFDGMSRQTIINLDNVEAIIPLNDGGKDRMLVKMISGNTLTILGSYYKLIRQLEVQSFRDVEDE
jgi:hypothetical protein